LSAKKGHPVPEQICIRFRVSTNLLANYNVDPGTGMEWESHYWDQKKYDYTREAGK
jgi:hypothetical protein